MTRWTTTEDQSRQPATSHALRGFWRGSLSLRRSLLVLGLTVCLMVCLTALPAAVQAQTTPLLLKQLQDRSQPVAMTAEELASLNDPLFKLLLKDHGDVKTLPGIIQQLKPEQQQVFVVDERLADPAPQVGGGSPASRRSIITFGGKTAGEELQDNVALSVFFNSQTFPSPLEIEAMAWDDRNSLFNYYKLERSQGETQPSWKFRGNSLNADLLSPAAREGTCMACHINGGMVMKEFKAPWNNWHSRDFVVDYLQGDRPNAWPIAKAATSPLKNLTDAPNLESTVGSANSRLNERRIAALNKAGQVTKVKRLLQPLFVSTEFNLMSSFSNSPSHPLGPALPANTEIDIPLSFFLNDMVLSRGLDISAFELLDFTRLSDRDYKTVLNRGGTSLAGKTPGDTQFAWFTPEASAIDNDYVSQLIEKQIVPRAFVAAVMAVDLETPVFSSDRERLWNASNILPTQFKTGRNGDLIAQTLRNLQQLKPKAESPEGQFLAALQSPDPVKFLQAKVDRYVNREKLRFGDRQTRPEEIARLYRRLLERRQQVVASPVQRHLIESPLLFPQGNIAALPSQVKEPVVTTRPTLKRGDRGNAVVELQKLLQQRGFLIGGADGEFGPGTERAVIAAQRSLNLTADGVVGPMTWAKLESAGGVVRPVLRLGDRGDAVVVLQQLLKDRGFFAGAIDGDFGAMTQRALITAQRQLGLEADGVVGPATWKALST